MTAVPILPVHVQVTRNQAGGWTVRCSHCGPVATAFTEHDAQASAAGHQQLHGDGLL